MKGKMKKRSMLVVFTIILTMVFSTALASAATVVTSKSSDGAKVSVDWNKRYTFAELEGQMKSLDKAYPAYSKLYSLGKSYEDRNIWCMEITDEKIPASKKTKIAVCGNIHGGERESGSCAMYSMWYLLENSDVKSIADILDKYIIYVIPVINPDGYEQSFVYNTRQNMNPYDHDGDGVPFSDTYADINGDGFIGMVSAIDSANNVTGKCGNESKDSNKDGILANDVKANTVDLNRNFDFLWGKDGKMDTEGPSAASEKEVQIVQNFFKKHSDIAAMTTLHTGIQTVLYPWCWRSSSEDLDNMADINFMKETALKMTEDIAKGTQRNFYTKSSYDDYPTYSELIDYTYGKFGIHSYTIEVYRGGSSEGSTYDPNLSYTEAKDVDCCWNDKLPEEKVENYTHAQAVELLKNAGIDPATLKVYDEATKSYRLWKDSEGLQIKTSSKAQMVNRAPDNQDEMVSGVMEGILTMIKSEKPRTALGITAKSKASKGAIKVSWTKSKDYDLDGYQVFRSVKKDSGYKYMVTTQKTTYTNTKGLKKGTTYYYKVRGYKLVNGEKLYTNWSTKAVRKAV